MTCDPDTSPVPETCQPVLVFSGTAHAGESVVSLFLSAAVVGAEEIGRGISSNSGERVLL